MAGDNNLAFKLRRRKLVVETLHLDVEGGVGERRTTPSKSTSTVQETSDRVRQANVDHERDMHGHGEEHDHSHDHDHDHDSQTVKIEAPRVRFGGDSTPSTTGTPKKTHKGPRRVAFQSDKPELYDF